MSYGQYSNEPKPIKPMFPCADKPASGRAKHVFGSHDSGIEHVWANPGSGDNAGTGFYQTHGRNPGGNFYFKTEPNGHRVIYSYRDSYPIGSLFTVKKGKRTQRVYLIRSGKPYSVTTSGHMSATRSAVPSNAIRFEVADVTASDKLHHSRNVANYIMDIGDAIASLSKARSIHNLTLYRETADTLIKEVKRYAKLFNVRLPKLPTLPKFDKKAFEAIKIREIERDAKRDVKRKAEREAWELERAKQAAEWKVQNAELIARWKQGENVQLHFGYQDYALLRVIKYDDMYPDNPHSYVVQTSQHVTVPVSGLAGAARLLRFLQALKANGRTYQRNGHTEHIGNFTVDSFNLDKNNGELPGTPGNTEYILRAGCHKILYSEIESVAEQVFAAEHLESQNQGGN